MFLIHAAIQTLRMDTTVDEEALDPNWEQAIAPYREEEIAL